MRDESTELAERMYDDCTWAMYIRINEYRQRHPVSASRKAEKRREGPLDRLNSETLSVTERDHVTQDSRGVYFEGMEDEIFEMEL